MKTGGPTVLNDLVDGGGKTGGGGDDLVALLQRLEGQLFEHAGAERGHGDKVHEIVFVDDLGGDGNIGLAGDELRLRLGLLYSRARARILSRASSLTV